MADSLSELRYELMEGIKLSMQRSYRRRSPAKKAMPYLISARNRLKDYLDENPTSGEAWELLSRAEECMLNYEQAISCLETAMSLAEKRDKRSMKRLALLRGSLGEWSALPVSPKQLSELGDYLVQRGAAKEPNGRTLQFTKEWLTKSGLANRSEEILEGLRNRGGYTDFTILYNVVQ